MDVPPHIFRQYDVRGVVDTDLTPVLAHALGRGVATQVQRATGRSARLAVGRDNRPSGDRLSHAVRDGIAAAGGVAVDVGVLPTPALYLALHQLEVDGGIQVTGSHNPPEFNGFKMTALGESLHGEAIQRLRHTIETDDFDQGQGGLDAEGGMLTRYADAIAQRNGPLARPLKVVVDCGNGAASLAAETVLQRVGADVVALYCESDGTFPNHHPDPTVVENLADLRQRVAEESADVGIAFDGDGDRIGVVDERGRVIYGDLLLALFGRDLARRAGSGHTVIFDVKCSDLLGADLTRSGLRPVMWKTGHSLIKAKMHETGAPLAGEMSGHMFFGGDYYGFDDALFAAARLLDYLAQMDGPLSAQLADLPPRHSTPEIRVDCDDEMKFAVVEAAVRVFGDRYDTNDIDGVRIAFPDGWGLIRASNTQPVIVMRFEAGSAGALDTYRGEVEAWLRDRGVQIS